MKAIDKWLQNDTSAPESEVLLGQLISAQEQAEYKEILRHKLETEYGIVQSVPPANIARIRRLKLRKTWAIAAGIALLCVAGIKVLLPSNSPQQLAFTYIADQQYFHPRVAKGILDTEVVRVQMQIAFNEKKYSDAVKYFSQIPHPVPDDEYYYGLALMLSDNPSQAIPVFDSLIENKTDYVEASRWYKALCLLLTDAISEAVTELKRIAPNEWNYELAKKYISKLD